MNIFLNIYIISSLLIFIITAYNKYSLYDNYFGFIIGYYSTPTTCLILYNVVIIIFLMFHKLISYLVFGELKENQRLKLIQKLALKTFNVLFIIIINSQSLSLIFFVFALGFLFLYSFHELAILRSQYLLNSHNIKLNFHYQILAFFLLLIFIDYQLVKNTWLWLFSHQFISFLLVYYMISQFLEILQPFLKFTILTYQKFTHLEITNIDYKLAVLNLVINIPRLIIQIAIIVLFYFKFGFNIYIVLILIGLFSQIMRIVNGFNNMLKLTEKIDNLTKVSKQQLMKTQDDTCTICFSYMEEGRILGCGHIFHQQCLKQWIQKNTNHFCPKCKKKFNFENKEVKKSHENFQKHIFSHFNNYEIKSEQAKENEDATGKQNQIINPNQYQFKILEHNYNIEPYQQQQQVSYKKSDKNCIGSLPFCLPNQAIYYRKKSNFLQRNNLKRFNTHINTTFNFKKQLQMLLIDDQ